MVKLTVCQGLPGSGKSTFALEEAKRTNAVIVNKDDIRANLAEGGWVWTPKAEKDVKAIRNMLIVKALSKGQDAISSDTNFGDHVKDLQNLAKSFNATFILKSFTDVPLETCIERDSKREKPVGAQVIKEMHYKYLAAEHPEKYVPDPDTILAIICDLDGTIALHNGRSPYDYKQCGTDKVNEPVAEIVRRFVHKGFHILYVSGRDVSAKPETEQWLKDHKLFWPGVTELWMRPESDMRKDYIVKLELFDQHIRKNYNVLFTLDDRDQVVALWRRLGLTCLQVAYGAF